MSAMKVGTEDKKKLIVAGAFGLFAVGSLVYTFVGGSNNEAPSAPPPAVVQTAPPVSTNAVSPAAQATARVTPSKLDPTLHPEGMLLTESLVYAGKGRNIFAPPGTPSETAQAAIPKPIASPRYVPQAPVNTGPPPPPPINLRYFGNATRTDGVRQAFLLQGEDVFIAGKGDIVSRRYKIGEVSAHDVEVTDLTNNNTQRLPLIMQ
ncbi:hypothetical protein [Terriglobus sp. TAA 43]|uniref:hypothetical protein n=1 Tax=Terriglobus sp. TAA 43 TaxID=278961 RepID=UPI0006487667|nr:hypothetical protein [Terriglobus sp. TAA 43]